MLSSSFVFKGLNTMTYCILDYAASPVLRKVGKHLHSASILVLQKKGFFFSHTAVKIWKFAKINSVKNDSIRAKNVKRETQ
jgi:hypothetical protein